MRSKYVQQVLDRTPEETHRFVDKYTDLVVLIKQLLKEKGMTQKSLAEKMGKNPSEINKWLSGNHNLTLRTICKLEVELGATLLDVRKKPRFAHRSQGSLSLSSPVQQKPKVNLDKFFSSVQTEKPQSYVGKQAA